MARSEALIPADADPGVHGFGEGGAMNGSIDRRHEREVELIAALFRERQANQAAAVLGHEVDGVGVIFSAAMARSPSFSRSSSSTRTTMRPWRISSTASSTVANILDSSLMVLKI